MQVPAYLAVVKTRRVFTCVGWQATLCDPIRQVMLRSSEMGVPLRAISPLTFFNLYINYGPIYITCFFIKAENCITEAQSIN